MQDTGRFWKARAEAASSHLASQLDRKQASDGGICSFSSDATGRKAFQQPLGPEAGRIALKARQVREGALASDT